MPLLGNNQTRMRQTVHFAEKFSLELESPLPYTAGSLVVPAYFLGTIYSAASGIPVSERAKSASVCTKIDISR